MLRASELDYDLPAEAVATTPSAPREAARLMVVSRSDAGMPARHARIGDLPEILRAGDLLVVNDTRVLPARFAARKQSGGSVEGLFLREATEAEAGRAPGKGARAWVVMLGGARLREGLTLRMLDAGGAESDASLTLARRAEEGWVAVAESRDEGESTAALLARLGATPLPPYIVHARKRAGLTVAEREDRAWYQTAYAGEEGASVAAPTAGLHFTPDLLARLTAAGVGRASVTLHVGTGTFKPIETEFVEEHPMHEEWFRAPGEALRAIEATRRIGGRVVCVGTTVVRALESAATGASANGEGDIAGATRLLITPGFGFRRADALLTNFHLPRSTLLALVAAFLGPKDGLRRLLALYEEAIGSGYRFYSYGDAMLILP